MPVEDNNSDALAHFRVIICFTGESVFYIYGKCRLYVESVVYFCATVIGRNFQSNGIDKAPENHTAREPRGSRCPPN